MYYIIILKVW